MGKTRLALQLASDMLASAADDFPNGIWLVQLADVVEPALVPYAVGLALEPLWSVYIPSCDCFWENQLLRVFDQSF